MVIFIYGFGLFPQIGWSQIDIKTMVYNILRFPSSPPANREITLRSILQDYTPDIFMVNELDDANGSNLLLNQSLKPINPAFEAATFINNQSANDPLQQMLYYNSDKFDLLFETLYPTIVRDINHYVLALKTVDYDTDPVNLHVFVTHLKSSTGTTNQQVRLQMVNVFLNALANVPANDFVLFAGDLNLYTASEPAYQALLNPSNSHVLVDPINASGSWSNNANFAWVHTQSTRAATVPGWGNSYATGGLDDRFDFILIKQNMMTNPKLQFVPGTYQAYGNNGNCFDLSINNTNCTGTYSQAVRDLLFNMSDHLPVVMQLQSNKTLKNASNIKPIKSWGNLLQNPSNQWLEILLQEDGTHEIEILNMQGQIVETIYVSSVNSSKIWVEHWPAGIYWIQNKTLGGTALKFLKR